jgi:LacI family transcriptional regulator
MLDETFSRMTMKPRRAPTMLDVARAAEVSLSTVSRVVNGDPTVTTPLAVRVRMAIERLGYRRDETASALRRASRTSTLIGLVVDDLANPFFSAVHRGVEDVARRRGVLTVAGSSDGDAEREAELIEAFAARRVDGMILAPVGPDQGALARDRDAGMAVVFVDRPGRGLQADTVIADNAGGTRRGVEHLVASGHQRIAYLGDRQSVASSRERLAGYREALASAGLDYDSGLVRLDIRGRTVAAAEVGSLLSLPDPPTALLTAQNLITIGAVLALKREHRSHEIALLGFDDIDLAEGLEPGLSVVAQNPTALGRTAAELLFERIDGDSSPPRLVTEPTELIARGSGEIAPRPGVGGGGRSATDRAG